jgi:hypothetical protein
LNDDFAEILLRIEPDTLPGFYRIEAFVDNLGLWTGGPSLAISPELLSDAQTASEYGHKLWSILNAWPHLQEAFSTAIGSADQKVRLRLMLSAAGSDLHRIDWEFLIFNAEQEPAGISPFRSVSRFLALPSTGTPAAKRTLRILLVLSNPTNLPATLPAIQVSDEVFNLFAVFRPMIREGRVALTILPGQTGLSEILAADLRKLGCTILPGSSTLPRITQSLRSQDVLHLIAHGNFLKSKPLLTLEDESGKAAITPGADEPDASSLIAQWSANRLLIFLQSCRSDPKDRFPAAGLGPLFVKAGVPAVVAMSDFVAMLDARRFANAFYSKLLETGHVDLAANAGRREIYSASSPDWAIPVLYSRLRSDTPLWPPDPLRHGIRALADQFSRTREVSQPFPIEVTVVRNTEAVEWELRDTTTSSRVDALITAKKELADGSGTKLIVLLGSHGRAKSSLLQKLFVDLSESCGLDSAPAPILINLRDCAEISDETSGIFQAFHAILDEREIEIDAPRALEQFRDFPFILLADGDQDIGSSGFISALSHLQSFLRATGRSAFLTMDESAFKPDLFDSIQPTVLVIRDLRVDTLRTYLAHYCLPNSGNQSLPETLQKQLTGPFRDLASIPWILGRLLELATGNSKLIQSRFRIVEKFVGDRLAKLSDIPGGATIARTAMQKMAWRLHSRGQTQISLFESYEILTELRGRRDFPLDGFRHRILESALMAQSGPDGLRFSYAGAQSYFTACYINCLDPSVRVEVLRGITAGLVRLDRLRLWQDVVVLLSGHMDQPSELISMLVDLGFSQGDHLLLAARCCHEAGSAGRTVDAELLERVADSLIAWSSPSNAIAPRRRRRAVDGFGYLLGPHADDPNSARDGAPRNDLVANCEKRLVRQALRIILERVRKGSDGKLSFDYSDVRFAALSLLFEHQPEFLAEFADPAFSVTAKDAVQKFIEDWGKANFDAMRSLLYDPAAHVEDTEKSLLAGLAAFALTTWGTEEAGDALCERFTREPVNQDLHWLITDALINLRSEDAIRLVTQAVEQSESLKEPLIDQVVYAIGRLGGFLLDSKEVDFLRLHLRSPKAARQGRALRSLAEIHGAMGPSDEASRLREACQKILEPRKMAEAQKLLGADPARKFNRQERELLASYALQALVSIGDAKSLPVLRRYYLHASDDEPVSWEQEQKRTTEEAAEQIRLRLGAATNSTRAGQERVTYALPNDSQFPGTLRPPGL